MASEFIALDTSAQDLLFREARTANSFTGEPVTEEQIQALYDLVKWAPTSFNQQPLRVTLVRSDEARARLVAQMWDNNQAKTQAAPLVAILAADHRFTDELPSQFPVFPQAKDVFFSDDAVRAESARLNATLQIAYFIIGVRAIGLAAGPMTGFNADAVSKEFLPEHQEALTVVNIGVPDAAAWYDRLPRLEYEKVFTTV
ncbi:hypothetical protein SLINC_5460 [Streptomyces lincolnensis]|uniref:Nitroreductase domain-containing protein n=1 Tax=Streptomyces lincolnensis TaxID=1915 RepID=A0A1B1MGJ5_STRLN|nr:malonic semialdehyde reductase [Streptomyces lincolnensis]ANS67684.1 hypothetical protein SLINC_5460 [Streptomyces lincolnensis]AXG54999.1 hypothetical protein SLCG_3844 [Streptomyces lincolnensis]QMV09348.1 malonic semialdehyde reductase [Streptomyces lincolnensis]